MFGRAPAGCGVWGAGGGRGHSGDIEIPACEPIDLTKLYLYIPAFFEHNQQNTLVLIARTPVRVGEGVWGWVRVVVVGQS